MGWGWRWGWGTEIERTVQKCKRTEIPCGPENQPLVDALPTRVLSLCMLPLSVAIAGPTGMKGNPHFNGPGLLAWSCPLHQEQAAERLWVWTSPGVYLFFFFFSLVLVF